MYQQVLTYTNVISLLKPFYGPEVVRNCTRGYKKAFVFFFCTITFFSQPISAQDLYTCIKMNVVSVVQFVGTTFAFFLFTCKACHVKCTQLFRPTQKYSFNLAVCTLSIFGSRGNQTLTLMFYVKIPNKAEQVMSFRNFFNNNYKKTRKMFFFHI